MYFMQSVLIKMQRNIFHKSVYVWSNMRTKITFRLSDTYAISYVAKKFEIFQLKFVNWKILHKKLINYAGFCHMVVSIKILFFEISYFGAFYIHKPTLYFAVLLIVWLSWFFSLSTIRSDTISSNLLKFMSDQLCFYLLTSNDFDNVRMIKTYPFTI